MGVVRRAVPAFVRSAVGRLRRATDEMRAPTTDLDLSRPSVARDPFSRYGDLRRRGGVHYRPADRSWIVVAYHDVALALSRPELFSSAPLAAVEPHLLGADPPAQAAVRRALGPALAEFARHSAEQADAIARRLLEPLARRPHFDAVGDFARPLTEAMAAEWLGLDAGALAAIRSASGEPRHEVAKSYDAILPIMRRVGRDSGGFPKWEAILSPTGIDADKELPAFLRFLWTAASRTSRSLMVSSIRLLLDHPEARVAVVGHDDALPGFLEEAARMEPPEHLLTRQATTGATLSGVEIAAGDIVRLCIAAANRDPLRFEDPESFLPGRSVNPHLTFGAGPHRCPGATAGRAQVVAALRAFLDVMPHFREVGRSPRRYIGWPTSRALERLSVAAR